MRPPKAALLAIVAFLSLAFHGCAAGAPVLTAAAGPMPLDEPGGGADPRPLRPEAALALPGNPSLEDYLRYAALNNAGLEAAFNRWKAALERVPQVRAMPDPRFTYGYYIQEVETRVGPQQQAVALSQMFPWFGKLGLRGDVAMEEANAAERRYVAEKLELFYRVKDAFYEHYYLHRAIAVVERMRDLMTYLEQVARARYEVGGAEHADLIRAQVELGKIEDRLSALRDLEGPVVARLNAALNRPSDAPLPPPGEAPQQDIAVEDAQVLEWIRQSNPELQAMGHEVARHERGVALAGKDFYPDVTLGLNYIDTDEAIMSGVRDSGKDPVIASVSVNVPLWRGKYHAGVREARRRHRAALMARAERENMLHSRATMVLYRFRDAERKIDLYRDTLVPKARQALEAGVGAFRAGRTSFLDLVDSERMLLEFELSYERALADRAQRLAELELLAGRELTAPMTPAGPPAEPDEP